MSNDHESDESNPSPDDPNRNPRLEETKEIEETVPVRSEDERVTRDQLDRTEQFDDSERFDDSEQLGGTVDGQLDITVDAISENAPMPTTEPEKTVADAGDVTQELDSALDGIDVTQTINPRELSKQGAAAWNEVTVGAVADQTRETSPDDKLSWDSERSFTETNLQIRGRKVTAPKDDPSTPSDYRLVRILGKGGMGNVYVAKQGSLDRMIAVKVIKPLEGKRRQQLEQTGRLEDVERDRRNQFLSEAVVTGDLDHPNIVPIHDIAVTSDNTLFYAMKRVVGTPWSKVIRDKSRDENLDILLKVCDAIGFAHTRGVVHRDIKPENIMLGDFGVVMVMDWGLALAQPSFEKIDSIVHTAGLGGTPAFMAPEMATGPPEAIGPAADIYLLGATLYLIVTGSPPHHAENVSLCLRAVKANEIREVKESQRGELLDIALKAMATDPAHRYGDVREFQAAIRQYRSHAESVMLAERAEQDLGLAKETREYAVFSRARFGFEQALSLWDGNHPAKRGLAETTIEHAAAANRNEDFDLGLSLLDANDGSHQPLIESLLAGRRLREQRVSRLRLFKQLVAAMLAIILVGGCLALYTIEKKRRFAESQKREAVRQTTIAEARRREAKAAEQKANESAEVARAKEKEATESAEAARVAEAQAKRDRDRAQASEKRARESEREALASEKRALESEKQARASEKRARDSETEERRQREIASDAKAIAEYEGYLSQIGLAKARVDSNEFDDARRILNKIRNLRESQGGGLAWEWRWLSRQANQSSASRRSPAALMGVSLAPGTAAASPGGLAVLADGRLQSFVLNPRGGVDDGPTFRLPGAAEATAVAYSPSGSSAAVGTIRGDIQIWDRDLANHLQTLSGHELPVTCVQFIDEQMLISGSKDKTARYWSVGVSEPLETCWHIAPVTDLSAVRVRDRTLMVTAASDSSTGRAVVWSIPEADDNAPKGDRTKLDATRLGEFDGHGLPITAIAMSAGGDVVASGDVDGNVLVWEPDRASTVNYSESVRSAVKGLDDDSARAREQSNAKIPFRRLIDPDVLVDELQGGYTESVTESTGRAHLDVIKSITFSPDGQTLLTSSDDYTLKLWDQSSASLPGLSDSGLSDSGLADSGGVLLKTLRGHGGWVTDASFPGPSDDDVVSVSRDMTIRRWKASEYVGAAAESVPWAKTLAADRIDAPDPGATDETTAARWQAHRDEIWSARFDTSGTRVVTASRDHSARVLEIDPETMTFTEIATMEHDPDDSLREGTSFMAMSFAVDRNRGRLFVGSADATIRLWDLEKGNEIGQASGTGLNSSFALSRDGTLLLTGSSSTRDKAILWRIDPAGRHDPKVLRRIRRHQQAVTAFAISDDNRMIFTGDRTGLGYLWDVETGEPVGDGIEIVRGYRINAACFTRDSRQLLIAADDQQVSRVDIATGKRVGRLELDGFATQLSLSADGNQLVTLSESNTPRRVQTAASLWDLAGEKSRLLYRTSNVAGSSTDTSRITGVQFGDQDRWVVVAVASDGDRPARVMRFDSRKPADRDARTETLQLPRQIDSLHAAMPIGNQRLMTLCGDAAFLWDLDSMNHLKSYRDHGAVTQSAFSHDGRFVATASRSVKIWDAATGRSLAKLESPHDGLVRSVDFSPKAFRFATTGDDGLTKVWSWDPDKHRFRLITTLGVKDNDSSRRRALRCVRFSPDGNRLLVAGESSTARLWSLPTEDSDESTATSINLDMDQAGDFTCAAFSRDGQWIALGSDDKIGRVRRATGPGQPSSEAVESPDAIELIGHADQIEDIAIIQDASGEMRVLTASRDKTARVWDPRIDGGYDQGREVISLRRHSQGLTAVDSTADGRIVMTAGRDGTVVLWPAAEARPPGP